MSLARLGGTSLLSSIVVVAGLGVFMYAWLVAERASAWDRVKAARAQGVASELAGRFAAYGEVVASVARSAAVVGAFERRDFGALRAQAQSLHSLLPHVLRVRFLTADRQEPDEGDTPALGYACLDLARQSASSSLPPTEAHLFGGAHAHVDVARPVYSDGAHLGAVLVSFDPAVLRQAVNEIKTGGGRIEVEQAAGGLALAQAASGPTTDPPAAAAVPGTAWRLNYYALAQEQPTSPFESVAVIFGVALGALILLQGALLIITKRLITADTLRLGPLLEEMLRGRRQQSYGVRLAEIKGLVVALEQRFRLVSIEKVAEKGKGEVDSSATSPRPLSAGEGNDTPVDGPL